MAATYNTIPAGDASDSQTLLPSKPKTSTKFIVVAAAVASFALGAVFATATQSKVAPSAVAQAAFHSHHHRDPCADCSMGGCQCWGPETYGCDQRHCKNVQYVQCDAQCGNQPVRQAGLEVLFIILAASMQHESAWRPRTRRLGLIHPNV